MTEVRISSILYIFIYLRSQFNVMVCSIKAGWFQVYFHRCCWTGSHCPCSARNFCNYFLELVYKVASIVIALFFAWAIFGQIMFCGVAIFEFLHFLYTKGEISTQVVLWYQQWRSGGILGVPLTPEIKWKNHMQ